MLPNRKEVAQLLAGKAVRIQEEMDTLEVEVPVTGGWNGTNIQRLFRTTQRLSDLVMDQSHLIARMSADLDRIEEAKEN